MINKRDLDESIAELEGARNHSPQMCQQLASLYIIREKLFNQSATPDYGYSMASAPMAMTLPEPESMDEMKPRKGSSAMSGRADSSGYAPFNKEMAMEWTRRMENADGSMGPHWTMDQVKKVMAQHNVECDPAEFYAAMNATFSDLAPFFKKYNISNMDAYVDYVKMFWLDDKDAPDKVAKYYQCIVE